MEACGRGVAVDRAVESRLSYSDREGHHHTVDLSPTSARVTIGRSPGSDLLLTEDDEVSRLHAVLECVGSHWTILDDGLSRNGTFVNGERLAGRRRLRQGDSIRIGGTKIRYLEFGGALDEATRMGTDMPDVRSLTDTSGRSSRRCAGRTSTAPRSRIPRRTSRSRRSCSSASTRSRHICAHCSRSSASAISRRIKSGSAWPSGPCAAASSTSAISDQHAAISSRCAAVSPWAIRSTRPMMASATSAARSRITE